MKNCLLCRKSFENNEVLKQHYQDFHNVYSSISSQNLQHNFTPKKGLPCGELIPTTRLKKCITF